MASSQCRSAEATKQADIVNILLPDEVQADIYRDHDPRQPRRRATF